MITKVSFDFWKLITKFKSSFVGCNLAPTINRLPLINNNVLWSQNESSNKGFSLSPQCGTIVYFGKAGASLAFIKMRGECCQAGVNLLNECGHCVTADAENGGAAQSRGDMSTQSGE